MLDDIGPWDYKFGEAPEELLRVEPDGKIIVGDIVLDGWVDVVRCIKATECLSAEDAKFAVLAIMDDILGFTKKSDNVVDSLYAYARKLEGSDE